VRRQFQEGFICIEDLGTELYLLTVSGAFAALVSASLHGIVVLERLTRFRAVVATVYAEGNGLCLQSRAARQKILSHFAS
jgi:hypothetical protein